METGPKPVELDKDIVYNDSEKRKTTAGKKIPWIHVVGITGVILILALLLVNPDGGSFIESPPPAEQVQRDSIFTVAGRIQQYIQNCDSLPCQTDIQISPGVIYGKDSDLSWTLETESGLFYSSDMDINEFRLGEI